LALSPSAQQNLTLEAIVVPGIGALIFRRDAARAAEAL
jgi:hypothetical protein